MKKSFTLLFLLLISPGVFIPLLGQSPEKFSYQAVIRDNVNQLVINQSIGIQISILQGSATGTAVYVETHTPVSNDNGLITLEVGGGSVVSGSFSAIDWASGPYFIKTEADPTGGTGYTITGVSQLISVPYALHAGSADTVTGPLTETDPVFGASTAAGITGADTATWNAKLDTETDPVFGAWDRSTGITITESQVTDLQNYLLTESDPAFNASVAAGITGADTASWNAKLDTETDPVFGTWDRSTGITITESQVTDLQNYLLTESDPAFNASVAAGITSSDTASWNQKLDHYTETQQLSDVLLLGNNANATQIKNLADPTDDQDAVTKIYVDNKAMPSGTAAGEMLFWDGAQWIPVNPGTHGQTLTFCNGVPTWGPCPTAPGQPSPINGPTDPCENETGLIYNVTQEAGVTNTWTVPTGWSITAGQGTHEITVTAGTDSGNIEVVPSNIHGAGPAQTLAVTTQVCIPTGTYPPGYVHCDTANPTAVVDVTNPITGKTWMDRNLGAVQVATGSTDSLAYGDLYQWGRFADGHQCRNSATTTTLSTTDQPGHGDFIIGMGNPWDWRSPQNDNLWQGVNGVNNPCPIGYRMPTEAELNAERLNWISNDAAGAFASPLKLTMAGFRYASYGSLGFVGSRGRYWSSTISGPPSLGLYFTSTNADMNNYYRAHGFSVRCLKTDDPPAQPSPINGPSNPCENETGLIYNVTQGAGVTYAWTVPTGWNITAGQGTHEITVTAGTDSGNIEVVPSNIHGAGPAQTLAVTTQVCAPDPYPPGYVHCDPANPTAVVDVTNPSTGRTWMDRNLGAAQAATSSTDSLAYGDLYQWGRFADGHQCRNSDTITTLSITDQPGHGDFILAPDSPYDWRSPQNDNLWQGVNGVNNPCPTGYRLPTEAELDAERLSWISNDAAGATASSLKLTMAGGRGSSSGSILYVGSGGYYSSSTVSGILSRALGLYSASSGMQYGSRARGNSVRCIKDY